MDKELLPFKERTPENIAFAEKAAQNLSGISFSEQEEKFSSIDSDKDKEKWFAAMAAFGETL